MTYRVKRKPLAATAEQIPQGAYIKKFSGGCFQWHPNKDDAEMVEFISMTQPHAGGWIVQEGIEEPPFFLPDAEFKRLYE